jgi:hypothetical protein
MNTDFVPLSSLLESMKAPSFEELDREISQSKPVEKPDPTHQVQSADTPPAPPGNESQEPPSPSKPAPDKVCSEPKVLLDRDGDKISRIRVLCSCGQSIVLDCKYPG